MLCYTNEQMLEPKLPRSMLSMPSPLIHHHSFPPPSPFFPSSIISASPTAPIPRPLRPPPLPHLAAIKLLLPQFPIDLIVRLTHPPPQPLPPFGPGLIPRPPHPVPEILRAMPARVQLGEQGQELGHLGLLGFGGRGRVGGGHGVEEGPGGAAEGFNVRGAVGGEGGYFSFFFL